MQTEDLEQITRYGMKLSPHDLMPSLCGVQSSKEAYLDLFHCPILERAGFIPSGDILLLTP